MQTKKILWCGLYLLSAALLLSAPPNADSIPGEGLILWLRADLPGHTTGTVKSWKNYAPGPAGDAVQTDPERQPRLIDAIASLSGKPALAFDGNNDFLHLPDLCIGENATCIIVAENAAQTEGGSYWRTVLSGADDSFRDGAATYSFGFRRAEFERRFIANLYYAPRRPHRVMEPGSPHLDSGFHIYSFSRKGKAQNGMTLRSDGKTVAHATADKNPPGFPGTGYTIGQGGNLTTGKLFRFYRGRIAEIIVYNRVLAAFEVLKVESYLSTKYGLACEYAPPVDGLVLWLDASTLPQGTKVGRWSDESGAGHHAVQNTKASRPVVLPQGIAVDFSAPASHLDFSGWIPPETPTVYAAMRKEKNRPAEICTELPALDPNWRGTGERFRGQLAELLVYDHMLSSDESREIELYLKLKYAESPDPRCFSNGTLIFRNGYNDQPYIVKCRDGSWLTVITTSNESERGADRTLVVTCSTDCGATWSPPEYSIEPREMRQPSWATLYVTPYGRIYVFYNLRGKPVGQPSGIRYYFKFSDDNGRTWSSKRYRMPLRKIALDRTFKATGGWSVCPPIEFGSSVLVSYTRFAAPERKEGQGFVFRSDNLQTERDPEKVRWAMLPAGDTGIRAADVESSMQEEHIITPLPDGGLLCIWRSTSGYACQGISIDGGRTWKECDYARYRPGGRRIKQPLACCRPHRLADGRYLLWFHNTEPAGKGAVYRPRDVVWIAGGEARDGAIHWSQPEVLLYGHELPVNGLGMSYPDFIEADGNVHVTTTDKEDARIFTIDPHLLEGIWGQEKERKPPQNGLVLELNEKKLQEKKIHATASLPCLLHQGFTVGITVKIEKFQSGLNLVDCKDSDGKGWSIQTAENRTLRIELNDRRHPPVSWTTDAGLLRDSSTHTAAFIVDGGPDIILALVDGILCDGGEEHQRGWGRFSSSVVEVNGNDPKLRIPSLPHCTIQNLRIYNRPLRVSEAMHCVKR